MSTSTLQSITMTHLLNQARSKLPPGMTLRRVPVLPPTRYKHLQPYAEDADYWRQSIPVVQLEAWYQRMPFLQAGYVPLSEEETRRIVGNQLAKLLAAWYIVVCRIVPMRGKKYVRSR